MFYQVFVLPNSDFSDWDIMMIMIALKGVIRDFLQSPHCTANCLQYIRSIGQGAIHAQDIERLSHATCHVALGTKEQHSYSVCLSFRCLHCFFASTAFSFI